MGNLAVNGYSKCHLNEATRSDCFLISFPSQYTLLRGNVYHASDLLLCAFYTSLLTPSSIDHLNNRLEQA